MWISSNLLKLTRDPSLICNTDHAMKYFFLKKIIIACLRSLEVGFVSFPISNIFWGACPQSPLEDKGPSAPFDNSGKCQRYAATCFKSYWKHCVKPILRQLNNHVYSVLLLLSSRPHCIEGSLLSYDHTGEHIHVTILKICQIWVLPSAVTSNTPTHVMSCNDE